jgi:hypothetical protein
MKNCFISILFSFFTTFVNCQKLAPLLNEKSNFVYVDSITMNKISNSEYYYAEPFDYVNNLAIVHLLKSKTPQNYDKGLYYEVQLINKNLNPLFISSCKDENDRNSILRKVYDTGGKLMYFYCELAHYDPSNNYIKDKYGLLDTDGKVLIKAKYAEISNFSEGVAIVKNFADQYGFIDIEGKEILKPTFSNLTNIENGRSIVQTSIDTWVFIDKYGNELGQTKSNPKYEFYNGVYKVNSGSFTLFKDRTGKTFMSTPYETYGKFYNNEVVFFYSNKKDGYGKRKMGLLDFKGKVIKDPTFLETDFFMERTQSQNQFFEGLASVKTESGWGYINTKGYMVINDKYSDVRKFSEGIACVKDLYGWNYINSRGEIVIKSSQLSILNNTYKGEPSNFVNGYAKIYLTNGLFFYIDKAGREYKKL